MSQLCIQMCAYALKASLYDPAALALGGPDRSDQYGGDQAISRMDADLKTAVSIRRRESFFPVQSRSETFDPAADDLFL